MSSFTGLLLDRDRRKTAQHHLAILLIHHLRKSGGQQRASLTITGRDVPDQCLALSGDRGAILRLLEEQGRPLSPKEMALALNKARSSVARTVHFIVKQGMLQAVGRGLYQLVSSEEGAGV